MSLAEEIVQGCRSESANQATNSNAFNPHIGAGRAFVAFSDCAYRPAMQFKRKIESDGELQAKQHRIDSKQVCCTYKTELHSDLLSFCYRGYIFLIRVPFCICFCIVTGRLVLKKREKDYIHSHSF
jgi:hypothetical protein